MKTERTFHSGRRNFLILSASAALIAPFSMALAQTAASDSMKIGIIGSGKLGGTVGGLWTKAGHRVMFSSRHPDELKAMAEELGPNAKTGTVANAVSFGEVILIAVPYAALPQVGADNAAGLKGKVVLDACNPIASRDGDIVKEANENGVGATSAKYLPGTRLVRAFNSFGSAIFAHESNRTGEKFGVPIASDDAGALIIAAKLVRDAGFEPVAVPLARAKEFGPPAALFRKAMPASELKQALGIAQ
jgi:8-hydroxy-5-deazaflavin:NADPH oxidoreductase